MTLETESPAELHADHRHWKSDISMWRFDLQQWRSERETALKQVEQIAEAIQQNADILNEHADAVDAIEAELEFHEESLASSLQEHADSDLDDSLLSGHADSSKRFDSQREAHERLKKRHHIAVAQVAALKHALDAAK